MNSIALFTEEMDDLEMGVAELMEKYKGFQLKKNSVGIIFCHPDTDFEELLSLLKKHFDFPIIGCTALSMFTASVGYVTQGISFHILTGDDVEFVVGMTDELTADNMHDKIVEKYRELAARLPEREKVIITYSCSIPSEVGDRYSDILSEVSNNSLVYGAMCSDEFNFEDCRVFFDDTVRVYGLVMILVSGNVKPILEHEFSINNEASLLAIAHGCHGNKVERLGNKSFLDAIRGAGINSNFQDVFTDFVGMPFLAEYTAENGDHLKVMRHLTSIDLDTGAGNFLGSIPEGAKVHLCLLNRLGVKESVASCAQRTLSQVIANQQGTDYVYTTLLVTSCAARVMTFANDVVNEAKGYLGFIPESMNMSGIYSFGEFCPEKGDVTGENHNMFYNTTFTLLVM